MTTTRRSAAGALAGEAPPLVSGGPSSDTERCGRPWPIDGDACALRDRLAAALRVLDAGRTGAASERHVRALAAALSRRGDDQSAARALLTVARAHVRRGRIVAARASLADARACAGRASDDEALRRTEVAEAALALDLGDSPRYAEAEDVLRRSTQMPAEPGGGERAFDSRMALARLLFWRSRPDEARAELVEADRMPGTPAQVVMLAAYAARTAAARRDVGAAHDAAERAVALASRLSDPGALSRAWRSAAFVHMACGERDAALLAAGHAVTASRAAREPMSALRARLLAAEVHRRGGRPGVAKRLLGRVAAAAHEAWPATIRLRVDLLRDLLAGAGADRAVERLVRASGLPGLRLFVPDSPWVRGAEVCGLVDTVNAGADDRAALHALCRRVRATLQATTAAFALPYLDEVRVIACDGSPMAPGGVRVAGLRADPMWRETAAWTDVSCGVRLGDHHAGALVAAWRRPEAPGAGARAAAESLLMIAASLGAPALASLATGAGRRSAEALDDIVGDSGAMAVVKQAVMRAAGAPYPVLVEGESGSGKELVARAVHRHGPRRDRPLCAINCAALPDDLLEAELFGHARGAFTGAAGDRAGVFEDAHGGTLFLDEVGELSPRAQAKLLRVLQEGEVRRVGENVARRVDVRIVAATNRRLGDEAAAGRFRLDLLFRLDVVHIDLPPLRARAGDIPALVEVFWRDATSRVQSRAVLSAAVVAALAAAPWPGNVRELHNVLAALAVRAPRRGVIGPAWLPPAMQPARLLSPSLRLRPARRAVEERLVREALARTGGHRGLAARELGVSRQGLTKLLARLRLDPADVEPGPAPAAL